MTEHLHSFIRTNTPYTKIPGISVIRVYTLIRIFFLLRLVHVGKALQDQQWLLENLMARVEEKRSAVENTAKQIQGR